MTPRPYPGFPEDVRVTPLPDPLCNRLLAEIDDFAELKLILRALWLLSQERRRPKTLAVDRLMADPVLLAGVRPFASNPQAALQAALTKAVQRGVLLLRKDPETGWPQCLLNTPAHRRLLAESGSAAAANDGIPPAATAAGTIQDEAGFAAAAGDPYGPEPPALPSGVIFALYEDNIGLIGPQMAQYLQEAEERYPESWLKAAFAQAIRDNKRSWSYISAILRRWAANGRPGPYDENSARQHGKPEQHPETHPRREPGRRR